MGFVKLPNDFKEWEWFDDKETTHVYLWLLLSAAWSDRRYKGTEIKRGQVVTTVSEIADKCGVTVRQTRTILERLKARNKAAIKATPKFSIITLLDYDADGSGDKHNDNQMTNERQTERQTNDKPSLYNTEGKNIRNPETAPAAREGGVLNEYFDKFWSCYPKKTAKQSALKAFQKLNPDEELLNKMLSSLEQQKKSVQWTKDNGQYIPYPASWLNGRRWEDEPEKTQQGVTNNGTSIGYDEMPKTREEWLKEFDL